MKVAKSYADYTRRQTNLREEIRQEEIAKLQDQVGHLTDAQWKSRKEELRKETLQQLERQKSHLQQKESELTEKIKRQTEISKQLEERCKSLKSLESRQLTELRNQLQEKQLEAEQVWSKLTNTWAAEKITKDSKIDELDFIFLITFFFCFLLIVAFTFLAFTTASFLMCSFSFWISSFLAFSASIF